MTIDTITHTPQPGSLATALAAAQRELQDPLRNKSAKLKGRTTYRYAGLDDLLSAIRPVLAAHGVAFVQTLDTVGDQVVLRTRLWVEDGEEVVSLYPMQWTGSHHDRGSEITYARRYSLEAIVGVAATDDDDAHEANDQLEARRPRRRRSAPQAPTPPLPVPDTVTEASTRRVSRQAQLRPPHDSFPEDQVRFCARLLQHGTSFGDVARACEAKGWSTPAHWPQRKRDGLLAAFRSGTAWADLGLRAPAAAAN